MFLLQAEGKPHCWICIQPVLLSDFDRFFIELRHLLVQRADAVFHLSHFTLLHTGAKAEQASQQEQSKTLVFIGRPFLVAISLVVEGKAVKASILYLKSVAPLLYRQFRVK